MMLVIERVLEGTHAKREFALTSEFVDVFAAHIFSSLSISKLLALLAAASKVSQGTVNPLVVSPIFEALRSLGESVLHDFSMEKEEERDQFVLWHETEPLLDSHFPQANQIQDFGEMDLVKISFRSILGIYLLIPRIHFMLLEKVLHVKIGAQTSGLKKVAFKLDDPSTALLIPAKPKPEDVVTQMIPLSAVQSPENLVF